MHFLCLHGRGTSAKILEAQLAAIKYELGDYHTYDYAEGCIPWKVDPELQKLMPNEQTAFVFYGEDAESAMKAYKDLDSFLQNEGPYDGVICFSMSVPMVTTWMVHQAKQERPISQVFKCAIFFSPTLTVYDVDELSKGRISILDCGEIGALIDIPTALIWGRADPWAAVGEEVKRLCQPETRSVFVHGGGHEIPGLSRKEAVTGCVNTIRRTVYLARGQF